MQPTAEERAHLYEHGGPCAVPNCSCCPALTKVIQAAENAAFERAVAKAREMGAFGVAAQILALKSETPK